MMEFNPISEETNFTHGDKGYRLRSTYWSWEQSEHTISYTHTPTPFSKITSTPQSTCAMCKGKGEIKAEQRRPRGKNKHLPIPVFKKCPKCYEDK